MQAFQTTVDSLRILFEMVSSNERNDALNYLAMLHEELQDQHLRDEVEGEANKSLTTAAEQIIFERLAEGFASKVGIEHPDFYECYEGVIMDETDESSGVNDYAYSSDVTLEEELELKKYKCITCDFIGNNRKALYRHGRKSGHKIRSDAASVDASLHCTICDYSTTRRFNLDRHLTRAHFSLRNVTCNLCFKSFKENDTLRRHIKNVHNIE